MVLRHVVVDGYGVVYASSSRDRVVFASRPPDSVMCPACKDVLRKPRRAPCGHAFCASCAEECVKSTGTCLRCKMVVPADSWIPDETLMLRFPTFARTARTRGGARRRERRRWIIADSDTGPAG